MCLRFINIGTKVWILTSLTREIKSVVLFRFLQNLRVSNIRALNKICSHLNLYLINHFFALIRRTQFSPGRLVAQVSKFFQLKCVFLLTKFFKYEGIDLETLEKFRCCNFLPFFLLYIFKMLSLRLNLTIFVF